MDDIRRPQPSNGLSAGPRPQAAGPITDIAGVAPRTSAPSAHAMHGAPADVPSPQPAHPIPPSTAAVNTDPFTPNNPVASSASTAVPTQEQNPVQTAQPAQPSQPSQQATTSGSLLAEIEAQEKSDADARVEQAPTAPRPKRHGWFPIVMAVVIALGLLAGAGYAYWQNTKQTQKTTSAPVTKTVKKETTTTADIDAATKSIDDSLDSLGQTTDVLETDLSDATLGL